MTTRIAIIDGVRTPFCKAGGVLRDVQADDLAVAVVKRLMDQSGIDPSTIDEVVFGNVAQPAHATNIARVVALKAGLPHDLTSHTVSRNCASGMESITTAANQILAGRAGLVLAGGTESMSNIPLLMGPAMTRLISQLASAKSVGARLRVLAGFRPSFLRPVIGLKLGLTDPICGLNMGQTAEVLARQFHVTRRQQDEYALLSHQRANHAIQQGFMAQEIVPVLVPPAYTQVQCDDDGPRPGQSIEALEKLKP